MARKKLERYQIVSERSNVVEPGNEEFGGLSGRWNSDFFENTHDIVLEAGCGKGEYTVEMGSMFPDKNFIGIDIKGARIWKGSSLAEEKGLSNVGFIRMFIIDIEDHFEENEISEIWITFPDPRPKDRDIKRRLTSPRFLDKYHKIVKPGGFIHLKTDNSALFDYTLEVLKERNAKNLVYTHDLYSSNLQELTLGIKTTFEKKYLQEGIAIKYLRYMV